MVLWDTAGWRTEKEQQERLVVVMPYAVVDPHAVMVHPQHATVACSAVVCARWLVLFALLAESRFSILKRVRRPADYTARAKANAKVQRVTFLTSTTLWPSVSGHHPGGTLQKQTKSKASVRLAAFCAGRGKALPCIITFPGLEGYSRGTL